MNGIHLNDPRVADNIVSTALTVMNLAISQEKLTVDEAELWDNAVRGAHRMARMFVVSREEIEALNGGMIAWANRVDNDTWSEG